MDMGLGRPRLLTRFVRGTTLSSQVSKSNHGVAYLLIRLRLPHFLLQLFEECGNLR
jgi:hypothetical protein